MMGLTIPAKVHRDARPFIKHLKKHDFLSDITVDGASHFVLTFANGSTAGLSCSPSAGNWRESFLSGVRKAGYEADPARCTLCSGAHRATRAAAPSKAAPALPAASAPVVDAGPVMPSELLLRAAAEVESLERRLDEQAAEIRALRLRVGEVARERDEARARYEEVRPMAEFSEAVSDFLDSEFGGELQ